MKSKKVILLFLHRNSMGTQNSEMLLGILGCAIYINSSLSNKAPSQVFLFSVSPQGFYMVATHSHVERGCALYTMIASCKREIQSWKQEQDQLLITKLQCHSFLLCFPVSMGLELNPAQLYMGLFLVETALCTWTLPGHEKTGSEFFHDMKKEEYKIFCSVQKKCFNLFCSILTS